MSRSGVEPGSHEENNRQLEEKSVKTPGHQQRGERGPDAQEGELIPREGEPRVDGVLGSRNTGQNRHRDKDDE